MAGPHLTFSQERVISLDQPVSGKMHNSMKINDKSNKISMHKMSMMMDSCKTNCTKLMSNLKQMDAPNIMGTAQSILTMSEQLKVMSHNMEIVMANKELMTNHKVATHTEDIQKMMSKTAINLQHMRALTRELMIQVHKLTVLKNR